MLLSGKLIRWMQQFILLLNLLIALLILVVTFFAARLVHRLLSKERTGVDRDSCSGNGRVK